MDVHLCGSVLADFDGLPAGAAFWFTHGETARLAVKGVMPGFSPGAVVLPPEPDDRGTFFAGQNIPGPVLHLPAARIVPSVLAQDMSIGGGVEYTPGNVYGFVGSTALAFRHMQVELLLIDLATGTIVRAARESSPPVEIRRWAVAIEVWGRPVTLFTYPAGAPEMDFR